MRFSNRLGHLRGDPGVAQLLKAGGEIAQRIAGHHAVGEGDQGVAQVEQLLRHLPFLRLPDFDEPVDRRRAQRVVAVLVGDSPDDRGGQYGTESEHQDQLRLDADAVEQFVVPDPQPARRSLALGPGRLRHAHPFAGHRRAAPTCGDRSRCRLAVSVIIEAEVIIVTAAFAPRSRPDPPEATDRQ